MFVVTRKLRECLCIGESDNGIYVTVLELRGDKVRLGVSDKPSQMNGVAGKHADCVRQVYANISATISNDSVAGTAARRQSLRADGASGAAGLHLPDAPDHKTLIDGVFDANPETGKESARRLGVLFKNSPAVAALSALEAVLRQNPDSAFRAVLTVAITAIAGKKYLDESLKKINNSKYQDQLPESPKPVPPKLENVNALFADLPEGYDSLASDVDAINQAYRRELAMRLTPAFKAKIQEMPSATYEEKKDLVQWVNTELRRFGLAIKSPKTGRAATLRTDGGNHPEEGRFRLASEGEDGKKESFSTPRLSEFLDHFVLMDAPPRREGLAGWHDRVSDHGRVPQRG
jgi:sRNA-binding carbon storage regulator CsrA